MGKSTSDQVDGILMDHVEECGDVGERRDGTRRQARLELALEPAQQIGGQHGQAQKQRQQCRRARQFLALGDLAFVPRLFRAVAASVVLFFRLAG